MYINVICKYMISKYYILVRYMCVYCDIGMHVRDNGSGLHNPSDSNLAISGGGKY